MNELDPVTGSNIVSSSEVATPFSQDAVNSHHNDSFFDKLQKLTKNRWVRSGITATLLNGTFLPTISEAAFAQQANNNSHYLADSLSKDNARLKNIQPLSESDKAIKDALLAKIDNKSGTLVTTDQFKIYYVATAKRFMVDVLSADADAAKAAAESWLTEQGLSPQGECNLPEVVNLAGEAKFSAQNFNPIPSGCQASDSAPVQLPTENVAQDNGLRPDTDVAYQQSYEQIQKDNLANPDPKEKIANLRPLLPFQDSLITLAYSPNTDRFILDYNKGQEAGAMSDLNNFLVTNGVDPDYFNKMLDAYAN